MARDDRSLGLDIDSLGKEPGDARVARIAVIDTRGCTRDGSADTITADCRTMAQLEREAERLRSELDGVLREAGQAFGDGDPIAVDAPAAPTVTSAEDRPRPRMGSDLSVGDVMTREVRSVHRNDSLARATTLMEEGGFRHLLVLDDANEVVGVMSQRDIVFGPLAWSMGQGRHGYEAALERTVVKDVIHEDPRTIDSGSSLAAAAREMLEGRVGCLPVVDGDVLVGILTESDFLGLFA